MMENRGGRLGGRTDDGKHGWQVRGEDRSYICPSHLWLSFLQQAVDRTHTMVRTHACKRF